jgi:hypothetical protein
MPTTSHSTPSTPKGTPTSNLKAKQKQADDTDAMLNGMLFDIGM